MREDENLNKTDGSSTVEIEIMNNHEHELAENHELKKNMKPLEDELALRKGKREMKTV